MPIKAARPEEYTSLQRGLILATVTMATTLYATTILVVSVILPQMQGSLSATQDQIAWVVTFNILATAVATPMTGWLAGRFGRRQTMIYSQGGFMLATLACGLAPNLEFLVIARVFQGAFGAPLIPLAQATILDSYPKEKQAFGTAVFGMGVVIGPVIGPVLGGYLADLYDWRWAFFMIVPAAALSFTMLLVILPESRERQRSKLDWTGFLSLIIAVGAMQLMLDRGNRQDWFQSFEILIEGGIAILAFYVFIAHSLTTKRPFLNLKHLTDRNYTLGLMFVLVYGMLNFTPMVLFPPMLQGLLGYPNQIIGELLGARGGGAILGFFAAMWISKLDPRIGLVIGCLVQAASGIWMMSFSLDVSFNEVAIASAMQGFSVGVIWPPLTIATFRTIDPKHLAETSAIFHLLRNLGSSIFISLSVTALVRSTTINYGRLAEFITPYNENLNAAISKGAADVSAADGLARVSVAVARQAGMLGFLDAFA
ncbi:MAG: DHA2 family efflux MFS transporter permease subunit, partial [Alphaproteobacteria bacterium]